MNDFEHLFLKREIKRVPRGGTVVEVGSWTGGSAYTMVKTARRSGNPIKFYFIDPWRYGEGECHPSLVKMAEGRNIKEEFDERMRAFRGKYKALQHESVPASKRFANNSIDMVFLDGDHSYEGVLKDLAAWFPKVKNEGTICGHDYLKPEYGVTAAVNNFFSLRGRVENKYRSMWKVQKGVKNG